MQEFYTVNPDIVFRDEGEDGGLLFDPATGEVKILNECASLIMKCLDGKHSRQHIIDKLQEIFPDVESAALEQDVSAFLTEMKEKQLIGALLNQ